VAIAYDNMSKTSTGEMDKRIEKIDLLSIYNQEAAKKLFTETSGYFLANMIRNGTRDEGKRLIDERMQERENINIIKTQKCGEKQNIIMWKTKKGTA
jgi:hypothetical protein